MEKAFYIDGSVVTAKRFRELAGIDYKEKNIIPRCCECGEEVVLCASNTMNVVSHFRHLKKEIASYDDCTLAERKSDQRYRSTIINDWDMGSRLRTLFFEDENLKRSYQFCWCLCGGKPGALPVSQFEALIERADRRKIWLYAHLSLWMVPYVLLTLDDFERKSKKENLYSFYFSFVKKGRDSSIRKVEDFFDRKFSKKFLPSGKNMKDYPVDLSKEFFLDHSDEYEWIQGSLLDRLNALKRC